MASQDDMGEFVQRMTRAPMKGTRETLLAQHLAAAVTAPPLRKIRLILEAVRMLTPEERRQYEIDDELVDVVYTVAMALTSATKRDVPYQAAPFYWDKYEVYEVNWGFLMTRENFLKYILPWWKGDIFYWPEEAEEQTIHAVWSLRCKYCGEVLEVSGREPQDGEIEKVVEAVNHKCPKCGARLNVDGIEVKESLDSNLFELPLHTYFSVVSHSLCESGLRSLQTAFVKWAMPIAMTFLDKLTQVVDPSLYYDMLRLYRGERSPSPSRWGRDEEET